MNASFDVLSYGNYVFFVIFACLITVASYLLSHMVDAVGKRTKFSGALIAGTIVAFVSSLPEFISSFVGIFATNNPSVATGNLLGGEIFRTAMLAFTMLFFIVLIGRAKTTIVQVTLVVSQIIVFGTYFLIILLINNNSASMPTLDIIFTILSIAVILIYVFNLWIMIKKGKTEAKIIEAEFSNDKIKGMEAFVQSYFHKIKIKKIIPIFIVSSIIIIGASFCIAINTDWILRSWGWEGAGAAKENKTGFGYSLLLGIVTSIPETITVITLLKLKNINAAISDILGSNLFSCLILSIIDLSWRENYIWSGGANETLSLAFWCSITMIIFGVLIFVNWVYRKTHNRKFYIIQFCVFSLMFLCYVSYLIMSGTDNYIFHPLGALHGITR